MKKVIDLVFLYWKWIVFVSVGLTVISAFFIPGIKIDNSIEAITIDGDPDLALLQQMDKEFGSDEFIVISFKADDIFSPPVLSSIEKITHRIEKINNIERVLSLTNATTIRGTPEGFGEQQLIPKQYLREHISDTQRANILSNNLYRRWIFSDDGASTSIIAWIEAVGRDDAARWKVINEINQIIDEEKDSRKFYIFGMPVYTKELVDAMLRDQFILTPIVFLLIGILLYIFFRDFKLVILSFILIYICSAWAIGLLVLSGSTMNYVTNIMPVVILIVCICDAVHIISHYKEISGGSADKRSAIKAAMSGIGMPILLTSLTTGVGFFSLASNAIKPVRDFGIFTGIGVLFAMAVSITLLPLIMSFLNLKETRIYKSRKAGMLEGILEAITSYILKHKSFIFVTSVIIIIFSLVGFSRIEVKQTFIGMLKDSSELDEAQQLIDKNMAGSVEFDLLFQGEGEYPILEPENLKMIERMQQKVVNTENLLVRKTVSIVDYLKEMNQAINDGDPHYYQLPETKEEALDLLEISPDLSSLINYDYSQMRLREFTESAEDSVEAKRAFGIGEQFITEENTSDLKVTYTGRPKVFINMVDSLITAMIESFSLAFLVIFVMMIIVFRSFWIGFISMIINIVPAVITFGLVGWLNIPINMMTAMVPSIAIGIAVDDTIHLIWRIKKEIEMGGDYETSISRSLKSVGKPIVTTSIIISVGFLAFYFSEIILLTQFAFLTIATVFAALITDLFLGPVLFLVFKPVKLKKMPSSYDLMAPERRSAA